MSGRERLVASGDAAVSIAGDVSGPLSTTYIGTQVVARGLVPLRAAEKDPGAVFTAVGLGRFTGREWLAAEVDRFMAANPCGYVLVEAEAGLGKTAFAAWLVKTRGYVSHFSRYSEGTSVPVALANLAAQLVRQCGLDDQAPGGMLPEWAQTPHGFESMLAAAARAPRRQAPLVLVVDGLDEADAPDGGMPFGLPLLLPDGVFVVGTYRTGRAPRWPEGHAGLLRISRHDPRNRRDIDEYLAVAAGDEALAARLAEAGVEPTEFGWLLAERCGGVWVYLRYVLDELQIGLRRPDEISALPARLGSYYADQVGRWQQDPAWHTLVLPLLATLGAAGEALPAVTLARLAGSLDPAAVRRCCDTVIRPLLAVVQEPSAGSLSYEIYHASFRELLNGFPEDQPGLTDGQRYEVLALADELRQATAAAHGRICDTYLGCFGGLAAGLPVLADNPGAAGIDHGYPLRDLARHLCRAGRAADLHRLLAVEHVSPGNSAVNTWHAAHDHADTIISYLTDIACARSESAAATDDDLGTNRAAPTLAMELRYALIAASIATITDKISGDLFGHLIRTGMWPVSRALDHARRIVNPRSRFDALLLACGELSGQEQQTVLAQAVAAAAAITDGYYRAEALAGLAPHLPETDQPGVLAEAVAVATAITDEDLRADALAELAPRLSPALLAPALGAAAAITGDRQRALALTELLPYLPEAERPAVLAQALDASTAIDADFLRSGVLTSLTRYLTAAQDPATLAKDLAATVADMDDDADQIPVMTGLLPHFPEAERPAVLAQLLAAASAVTDDEARAQLLTMLAPHLPEAEQPAVLAQALDAVTAIETDGNRGGMLVDLAPHLPPPLLAKALTFVIATHDTYAWTLTGLMSSLPPDLLVRALAAASAHADDTFRAEALTGLVPHLPTAEQPAVLAQALDAATAITDNENRAKALTELVPQLPVAQQPAVLAQALAAATATSDYSRARTLTGLVPHLPTAEQPAVLAQALDAATTITDDEDRARALTELAPYLPAAEQPAVLAQALDAVAAMTGEYGRGEALTRISPDLPPDLLPQALEAAIASGDGRPEALTGLAPYLPPDLLAQALEAATITTDYARAEALTGLAPYLPPDLLAQALKAGAATDDYVRAQALTGLAPHLPAAHQFPVLTQALAAITTHFSPGKALAGLAPYLPPDLLPQALETAATTDDYVRALALTGLAPHLSQNLLKQALDGAATITDDAARAEALTGLAPYLPAPHQSAVLAQALTLATNITSDEQRATALTRLAQHLTATEQTAALTQALDAATATASDHTRARELTKLAPGLPPDLLPEALAIAAAITDDNARAEALTGLAPHLPADLLPKALGSTPRTHPQALISILGRSWALQTRGTRLAYIRLLRDSLTGTDRKASLEIVVAAAPAIAEISGTGTIEECVHSVTDIYRWWP